MNTLARLEIKIIMIEYELDAFLTHCQNKPGCQCIGPIAKDRLRRTRNMSRGVRDIIRNAQGFTQKTLTNPNTNTWGGEKKRAWGRGLTRSYDCHFISDSSKCTCKHIPHKENCFLFPFQQWKRGVKRPRNATKS
jgi:hypothetical protein